MWKQVWKGSGKRSENGMKPSRLPIVSKLGALSGTLLKE